MRRSIVVPVVAALAVPALALGVTSVVADRPAVEPAAAPAAAAPAADPAGTYWLGDLPWESATSSWGPVERNTSSGENAAGDGNPITLNGTVYQRGLGVVPHSVVRYSLKSRCSSLQAVVGVDDEVDKRGNGGSIVFKVVADGVTVFDSGVRWGAQWSDSVLEVDTSSLPVRVDLSGVDKLELVADPWHDGFSNDHGDWADARVTCAQAP